MRNRNRVNRVNHIVSLAITAVIAVIAVTVLSLPVQADSLYPVDHCRIVDQRFTVPATSMTLGTTFTFSAILTSNTVQGGESTNCGIPSTATAILASVVMVNTTGPGYLRAWPVGGTEPAKATLLNFFKQYDVAVANYPIAPGRLALIKLTDGQFNVESYLFTGQLVVDVEGYILADALILGGAHRK